MPIDPSEMNRAVRALRARLDPLFAEVQKVIVGLLTGGHVLLEGVPGLAKTLAACRLRLRPIMMTSLAFILGVVPLVVAEGAGAEMRRTLGTGRRSPGAPGRSVNGDHDSPDRWLMARFPSAQECPTFTPRRRARPVGDSLRPSDPAVKDSSHRAYP